MIGIWTLLLSVATILIAATGAFFAFRSASRIAIVLGVDAVVLSVLGVVLNSTTRGELALVDILIFIALPLALAVAAVIVGRRSQQSDPGF